MAESSAEWHAVRTNGKLSEFGSAKDLFDALRAHPEDFRPEPQDADSAEGWRQETQAARTSLSADAGAAAGEVRTATADAVAPRSVGIDVGNNTRIVFGQGCTEIAANSRIVAVEVTSLVVLSQGACDPFSQPWLLLWPDGPGVATLRDVPDAWQYTARSALAWY